MGFNAKKTGFPSVDGLEVSIGPAFASKGMEANSSQCFVVIDELLPSHLRKKIMFEFNKNSNASETNHVHHGPVTPVKRDIDEQNLKTFSDWLDEELAELETRFPEFETQHSYRGFMGRSGS